VGVQGTNDGCGHLIASDQITGAVVAVPAYVSHATRRQLADLIVEGVAERHIVERGALRHGEVLRRSPSIYRIGLFLLIL
jgi:hypothetical protein